jgi:Protein of unknown function (DUF1592)/Protein of unknown function (DUF1588)/Protein of unknown function (DUF1587)/Protein of unknown function (DUF1585)/Protein of unknown function (DUF1595)
MRLPCRWSACLVAPLVVLFSNPGLQAADPFQDKILPFVNDFCVRCHNTKKKSAELDLTRYPTAGRALEDYRQWEHVLTFVKKGSMPPEKAKHPDLTVRAEFLNLLEGILLKQARKLSGDPGIVPPRRLSNAEYDNTIHDLTGVDIRPAASFPLDPASGEGFNNTGEALAMSPNLFKKYYAGAELVADHALLTPSGLRFAPHAAITFADRQKYYEQAILRFYDRHSVDYEKYLTAVWGYQHRTDARKSVTPAEWAKEADLSPKYFATLVDIFQSDAPKDAFCLGYIRERFATLPTPADAAKPGESPAFRTAVKALSTDIQRMSKQLCPPETPAIIANAGNAPIDHIARRTKMAATRDVFDTDSIGKQRFQVEFRNVSEKPTLELVIQVDEGPVKPDGYVVMRASVVLNKKPFPLRPLLIATAPTEAEKLKFGVHPLGDKIDANSFVLKAPSTLTVAIPNIIFPVKGKGNAILTAECELDHSMNGVARITLHDKRVAPTDSEHASAIATGILVDTKHATAGKQFEESARTYCRVFPNRFLYVDSTRGLSAGFHLIEGFFRDDQPLCKSVLGDEERQELDRLWTELYFGTNIWEKMFRGFVFFEREERKTIKHKDFEPYGVENPRLTEDDMLAGFQALYIKHRNVTVTGDDLKKHPATLFFESIRAGLRERNAIFQKAQALYLKDIQAFAERAYRRPLTDAERRKIEKFYTDICNDRDHGIDEAVRASLVRILVSPHFCYHITPAQPGESVAPLSDLALASRLSYFIWSSMPDEELLTLAKAGKLHEEAVLRQQVKRMLSDPKVSRFALEFFGQWLGHRDFLKQESVNRSVFPTFDDALKQSMFEEPTRLITHLIQKDKPITGLLDSNETFVNKKLAGHYGIPFDGKADEWQLVEGMHARGRGGLLGMAVFLTKNSQPQRTSPVKRGFWVVHKLLGEHIPPPPPDVAVLPAKETEGNKTVRQLLVLHVEDARCARCHQRFDPIGLSMEGFDAIGRTRTKDLAGRPIDNVVKLSSGKEARGVSEFGKDLVHSRKNEFTRTMCEKFLGYALGRSLQLSDLPLVEKMQTDLAASDYHLSTVFELVVLSPQFRNQRCQNFTPARFTPVTLGAKE